MNLIFKLLGVLIDAGRLVRSRDALRDKHVLFAVALVILAGVQAMLPDLTVLLGAYGPAVSAAIGALVILLRTLDKNDAVEIPWDADAERDVLDNANNPK